MEEAKAGIVAKSIEQILQEERLVFIDSSVGDRSIGDWYEDYIHPTNNFLQLDESILQAKLNDFIHMQNIFAESNVHTIEKAVMEMKRLQDILQDKLKFLNKTCKGDTFKRERYRERPQEAEDNRELFEELCYAYLQLVKMAEFKAIKIPDSETYRGLEKKVMMVSSTPGIKADFSERYKRIRKTPKPEDLHANEQIVCMSLYKSLAENIQNAIITSNSNVYRILHVVKNILEEQKRFKEVHILFKQYPIKVYFMGKEKNVSYVLDTSDPKVADSYFGALKRRSLARQEETAQIHSDKTTLSINQSLETSTI